MKLNDIVELEIEKLTPTGDALARFGEEKFVIFVQGALPKEKIKAKTLEYENKLRNIEQAIVDSYSTSYFNKKQMMISQKQVEYTKESVKLAMLRFNNGKGILLDVIQAQSEATQARVEYANSTIRYNISQAELLFNTGKIDVDKIIKNYNP
jgi:outer membrane protein TolC